MSSLFVVVRGVPPTTERREGDMYNRVNDYSQGNHSNHFPTGAKLYGHASL